MSERFLRERKLLYPSEDLFQSLSMLQPPFQRLGDLHPIEQPALWQFTYKTYIRKNSIWHEPPLFLHQVTLEDILNDNIKYLLGKDMVKYVQTYGHQYRNGMLHLKNYNFGRTALEQSGFKKLFNILPTKTIVELIYNYTILVEVNGQHVQVTGVSLHQTFNSKIGEKKRKTDLKPTDYAYFVVNRFQIYYCTHFGRDPGIFRKNFFFQKGIKPLASQAEEISKLVTHYSSQIYKQKALHLAKQQLASFHLLFQRFIKNLRVFFTMSFDKKGKRWSPFARLIHYHCPLPNNYRHLRRQVESYKDLNKQQIKKTFEELYSNAVQYRQVMHLLIDTIRKVLPIQMLGRQNTQNLIDLMGEFVSMKRYENFKIEDILTQINVFQIEWLKDSYNPKFKKHIIGRRRKIIGKFICFLFNSLIVPILKYNFYITEQHKEANKIFYYRKPLWFLISTLALASFSQQNIKQISTIEHFENNNYPQGKLRIMPKKGTFRPIITFNRKGKFGEGVRLTMNLNQMLTDTQLVLRNLKNILGQKVGYCVFDNRQVAQRYDAFIEKWRANGHPPLSFFTLDIKKCYDSINPEKLLQIIKQTKLISEVYLIVKYLRIYRNKKPLNQNQSIQYYFNLRQRATAISLNSNPYQIRQSIRPPALHIHTPRTRLISREVIIDHLSHLCEASLITYQKRKWIQKFGIPQGLNVSGVLCSLYFAYLEDLYVKVKDGILMRLTDDYLYIGPEIQARKVLHGLLQCAKNAEFEFNQDKATGNFKSPHIKTLWEKDTFIWIGKSINIRTLQMYPVADAEPKKLMYSMNVNIPRKTMRNFLKNKLKSLLTNQFQSYFKPNIFSIGNLINNIQIFSKLSLDKFFPFLQKIVVSRFPDLLKMLSKILQIALHQFIVFACYLFNEKLISTKLYYELMLPALKEFQLFFKSKRYLKREVYSKLQKKFKSRAIKTERGLIALGDRQLR